MPSAKKNPAKTPRKLAAIEKLGPDDRVLQKRTSSPRNVDVDHANQVPDGSWEIGTEEDQQEAATAKKKKS